MSRKDRCLISPWSIRPILKSPSTSRRSARSCIKPLCRQDCSSWARSGCGRFGPTPMPLGHARDLVVFLRAVGGQRESRPGQSAVTDVKLLQGDLAEAWREGDTEYATVAMKFALKDSMVERVSGRTVEGGEPSEVTEFVDLHALPWRQSAALSHSADVMLDANHRPHVQRLSATQKITKFVLGSADRSGLLHLVLFRSLAI